MALTTLDPGSALILVDLQKGIVDLPALPAIASVVERAGALADLRPEAHDWSLRNVFPRLGETGTSQSVIDLLNSRSA